jgi:hypothetical protein
MFNTSRISLVVGNPLLWAYIFFLIRDATLSVQVDPVDPGCHTSDSCASFLLPGGLRTVAPWPYRESPDKSLTAYITKDAPAYQMDVWKPQSTPQWMTDDCTVYGFNNITAFQLCISYAGENTDRLVAGTCSYSLQELMDNLPYQGGESVPTPYFPQESVTSQAPGLTRALGPATFHSIDALQR